MNRRNIIPIIALLLLTRCSNEKFIPDPNDARLPRYTEEGNMVGGALVNDVAWKTRRESKALGVYEAFYFTNYANGDSVTLDLQGKFTEGQMKDRTFDFFLVFKGMQLKNITDLIAFEGRTFTLDGMNNYVIVYDKTDIENDVDKIISGGLALLPSRGQRKEQIWFIIEELVRTELLIIH